jgi:DNA-binding FadR family transcriptional regulator
MSPRQIVTKPIVKQTMAEQMAEAVQDSILAGELPAGAALPTEPELAQQFGVSRAVVRDATRILMARGLVEVQHGRGVFVTQPDNEAFGQALFLALRRMGASVWDVEQFQQVLLPEIAALAATAASEQEIAAIHDQAEAQIADIAAFHARWWQEEPPPEELIRLQAAYRELMSAIFAASHNRLVQQLARPLLNLRSLRTWAEAEGDSPQTMAAVEASYLRRLVAAIAGRDPDRARQTVARLVALPAEAVEAMRRTPVGEMPTIPVPLPRPEGESDKG